MKKNLKDKLSTLKLNSKFITLVIIALLLILNFKIGSNSSAINKPLPTTTDISYNDFIDKMNAGEIKSVKIDLTQDKFKATGTDGNYYITSNPKAEGFKQMLLEKNIEVNEYSTTNPITILASLVFPITSIIFFCIFIKTFKKSNQFNVFKSPSITPEISNVTFKDVAGLKEIKEDLINIVDMVKNPKKYIDKGAKIPKGLIFYGNPGTGKTLLAKAIAGEANVPFYCKSGSDFVELFVGNGAKKVRDLFNELKKQANNSPCILFIDEIDAIGKKRTGGIGGGNDERDQTLNQLLTEMDGFKEFPNIIIIGATNRLELLDSALLRPGRFDKHICVPIPETPEEREEVLNIYSKNKKISKELLKNIAKQTLGFSPADLENLLNEATIISVRKNKTEIDQECVDEAFFNIALKGHAKKNKKRDEFEKKLVAYHEAGHAIIGHLLGMDIPKVTIVPSTSGAGGVTFINPNKMGLYSKEEICNRIKMCYGGNVAEYLLLGDREKITTGASADIKSATASIKEMISEYGMTDEFGLLNLNVLSESEYGNSNTSNFIIGEAKKIAKNLYEEAYNLLKNNKDMLDSVSNLLMEKETITGEELEAVIKNIQNIKNNEYVYEEVSVDVE